MTILRAGRAAIDELHRRLAAARSPGRAAGAWLRVPGHRGARTTASELGQRLGVTKQAAGQMVDELARLGYVNRGPDPADGRRRLVR